MFAIVLYSLVDVGINSLLPQHNLFIVVDFIQRILIEIQTASAGKDILVHHDVGYLTIVETDSVFFVFRFRQATLPSIDRIGEWWLLISRRLIFLWPAHFVNRLLLIAEMNLIVLLHVFLTSVLDFGIWEV